MDDSNNEKIAVKRVVVIVILALIGVAVLMDTIVGGNILFYTKWIECGRKPVQLYTNTFWNAADYYYSSPAAIDPLRGNHRYVCTESEAKNMGYRERP